MTNTNTRDVLRWLNEGVHWRSVRPGAMLAPVLLRLADEGFVARLSLTRWAITRQGHAHLMTIALRSTSALRGDDGEG
jgi:hypothetical protein